MNPERTGRRVKNRIKIVKIDRIAIKAFMKLYEKKFYEKYPYLLEADGFEIEDIVYFVLDMFNNKDIEKFNSEQIEMMGEVFADTIVTFCKGYNKILELGQQEEEEND